MGPPPVKIRTSWRLAEPAEIASPSVGKKPKRVAEIRSLGPHVKSMFTPPILFLRKCPELPQVACGKLAKRASSIHHARLVEPEIRNNSKTPKTVFLKKGNDVGFAIQATSNRARKHLSSGRAAFAKPAVAGPPESHRPRVAIRGLGSSLGFNSRCRGPENQAPVCAFAFTARKGVWASLHSSPSFAGASARRDLPARPWA